MVVVHRNPNLLEIVLALCTACRFTSLLHGRQQKRNQNCNDGDDHQQFDERERTAT